MGRFSFRLAGKLPLVTLEDVPPNWSHGHKMGFIEEGVIAETLCPQFVHVEERNESTVMDKIEPGTTFEVIEVGAQESRIKIRALDTNVTGWITSETYFDQPLVKVLQGKKRHSFKGFLHEGSTAQRVSSHGSTGIRSAAELECGAPLNVEVGEVWKTSRAMLVHESEATDSGVIVELPQDVELKVLQVGANPLWVHIAAHLASGDNVSGWVSTENAFRQPVVTKVRGSPTPRLSSFHKRSNRDVASQEAGKLYTRENSANSTAATDQDLVHELSQSQGVASKSHAAVRAQKGSPSQAPTAKAHTLLQRLALCCGSV